MARPGTIEGLFLPSLIFIGLFLFGFGFVLLTSVVIQENKEGFGFAFAVFGVGVSLIATVIGLLFYHITEIRAEIKEKK